MGTRSSSNKKSQQIEQNQNKNNAHEVEMMQNQSRHYYQQILPSTKTEFNQVEIVSIGNKPFIILIQYSIIEWLKIYDVESNKMVNCDLQYKDIFISVFVNQNLLYVQTQRYLFQLHFVGGQFWIKKRYPNKKLPYIKQMLFINKNQDLILDEYMFSIRLRSLNPYKRIFKSKYIKPSDIIYDKKNNMLIYLEKLQVEHQQQYITIMNLQNRQIIIRQILSRVIQMVFVEWTIDILIQIHNQGLYLYKINYEEKRIQQIKILHYNVDSVCMFDNQNLLSVISHNILLKFDHEYNVIQRFSIQSQTDTHGFESLLPTLSNVKIKQNLPELLAFRLIDRESSYIIFQLSKSSEYTVNGLCLQQCENYLTEYKFIFGRTQHLISSNSKYMACNMGQSILFYSIKDKAERCINFKEKIRYINFSHDSNYLFVALDSEICGYKTNYIIKNFVYKREYIKQLQINFLGFIMAIDSKDQAIIFHRGTKKQIFKYTATHQYTSFDYQCESGLILTQNHEKLQLLNLTNRKQLNFYNGNKQCKFIQSTQNLLVLTDHKQLQLWSYRDQKLTPIFKIMDDTLKILHDYSNFYCVRRLDSIIILNQNLQIVEQIHYKTIQQNDCDVISQHDQLISRNYIIKIVIRKYRQIYFEYQQAQNFIISIEPWEIKND